MKKITLALLLSSAAMSISAFAADQGGYVAVDVGQSTAKDACSGTTGISCTDSGTAYRFGVGYQLNPDLAVEANYGVMASAKASGTLSGATINAEVKPKTLQVAAIGIFPVADAFALLGKLGIARTTIDSTGTCSGASCLVPSMSKSATSTKLAYGIGAQYDVSKSVGIRAQYEYLGEVGDTNTTGTAKISLVSAGVVFKF